jgi:hypothetical protein
MAFTVGIGRNSPIPITTDPQKFEGLIIRHGQWVRWSVARKCTCILENNRPNPRCTICRGTGWKYSFQDTEDDLEVEGVAVDATTIEMPYSVKEMDVLSVRLPAGGAVQVVGVYGKWIKVSGVSLSRTQTVYVALRKPRAKPIPADTAVYRGSGIIRVEGTDNENAWMKVPFDITKIDSVRRSNGSRLTVLSWSLNKIMIDTAANEPAIGERLIIDAEYMPPYKIAILNQNLSESERNFLQTVGGDSVAIFPFAYKVSEQDTITVWASSQVRKRVLRKTDDDIETLPDLFVSEVLQLSTSSRVYEEGVDYVLWDRNAIRWLIPEGERPAADSYYSVEYMANATYRVIQQMPNIRSAENKRFPSRVAVKLEAGLSGTEKV